MYLKKFYIVGCTTRNVKGAENIIAGCTTRNVKGAENIIASCTIHNVFSF